MCPGILKTLSTTKQLHTNITVSAANILKNQAFLIKTEK
jgi:hypothetical protein